MIPDLDIYRSANLLVKRYGEDAELEAASRVDAMIEAGDPDGAAVTTVNYLLLLATDAHAHGGGLDDLGCHHNRRAGGYHWLWEA